MITVQKFGGSSLADIEKLRKAAGVCIKARQSGQKTVLVVSAMGDTTDHLSELAHKIHPRPPARESDALMTSGEQQSAALMAIMLDSLGVPAMSFTGWQSGIFTNSVHGDADPEATFPSRIADALERGIVPVVTGYQGIDDDGDITALGRGGSDTTAVLLAAVLNADRCEIYTDVDGIYTADPRLVRNAKKLSTVDYRDMLALASSGSQVLHDKSVRLAMANGVKLYLLSPDRKNGGSLVTALGDDERPTFAGVTRDAEKNELTIVGKGCTAELLPPLVLELADMGIRVSGGGTRENCIFVRTDASQLLLGLEAVHDLYF